MAKHYQIHDKFTFSFCQKQLKSFLNFLLDVILDVISIILHSSIYLDSDNYLLTYLLIV
jgi:hypothetical protein